MTSGAPASGGAASGDVRAEQIRALLPRVTALNRPFFEGAQQGRLVLQRCEQCGQRWFPPAGSCPRCLSAEYTWQPASGRGRVWSWIVMHRPYFKAFEPELPYNVAFVELEEGPFLMTRVVGARTDELRCDLPVEVAFQEVADGVVLPVFQPVAD